MTAPNTCPQCQTPLPPDAPVGLCPRCLIRSAAGLGDVPAGAGDVDFPDIGDPADVARRLTQFEIIELLGKGGMGVVYKARQLQLDRLVALKILPPVDALSPDFVERFRREARALAKLNHPNIVAIYECGEQGGLYYFVMEFVDGANLRTLLQTKRLTPAEALAIVPQVCDALEYAHEEGIVHRDIKPENILIDKKGRLKIADFGLAKLLRREALDISLTVSGTSLGTLRYMAPEQMEKPETVDHRADIYSLGVVIYEMLTGEIPMGRFAPPSERAQVDVKLDEIVLRSLERDVERRYQHASEIKTDVERVTSKPQAAPAPAAPPHFPTPAGSKSLTAAKAESQNPDGDSVLPQSQTSETRKGKANWVKIALIMLGILIAIPAAIVGLYFTSARKPVAPNPSIATTHDGVTYLEGHTSAVKAVAVSPDGGSLVSAGMDGRVLIRDLPSGKVRRTAYASSHPKNAPTERFRSAVILPDGQRAIVGGDMRELLSVPLFSDPAKPLHLDPVRVPNDAGATIGRLMSAGANKLAYITAHDAEVVFYDIDQLRETAKVPLDPGFTSYVGNAVASPDGQFVAVTTARLTSKETDRTISVTSAPFKLTVFDASGAERLSWQFADNADFTYSQVVFADARTLAVCLPSGKMQRWTLDNAGQWQPAAEAARIVPGRYTACAASRDGKIIWLAEGHQITGIDSVRGKGIAFVELKIGEKIENFTGSAIDQIAVTSEPLTVAVALWDGKVALAKCWPIDDGATKPAAHQSPNAENKTGGLGSLIGGLFETKPEFRTDPSRVPTTRTPGRTDYAYAFKAPANHRLYVWLEWWKDGKRTIDQNFNTGFVAKAGQRYDAGVQVVFTDGNVAGPTTAGQTRIDWIFYEPAGNNSSGNWRPNFFAGMMTTSSWGKKSSWTPKVGETVTLLEIGGGKESVLSGPITDEGLRAGHWQAAMLLKARVEPVPESRMPIAPNTKMNAWHDNQEPTPALLGLAEQFDEKIGPFATEVSVREQIAYRIKKDATTRAKAEQMLKEADITAAADDKPEELLKKLEGIARKIPQSTGPK